MRLLASLQEAPSRQRRLSDRVLVIQPLQIAHGAFGMEKLG
jgi:hypothetical protein